MLHSPAVQVEYYSNYIRRHPGWEYVGVYADEAKTGTKDSREQFQQLLTDCKAGKIDHIITKSISSPCILRSRTSTLAPMTAN